jgi:hypothetical protein
MNDNCRTRDELLALARAVADAAEAYSAAARNARAAGIEVAASLTDLGLSVVMQDRRIVDSESFGMFRAHLYGGGGGGGRAIYTGPVTVGRDPITVTVGDPVGYRRDDAKDA